MAGNGVYFHPEVREAIGRPPPHLRLAIRPHDYRPFQIQGDREGEIGRWHHTARQAEAAIRDYCRQNLCTAFVRIFTPQAELWCEEWISVKGTVSKERPRGQR